MASKSTKKDPSTPPAAAAVETTALVPDAPGGALALEDYSEFSDAGEGLTKDDLLVTRFRVVQGMTRAKKKNREMRDGDIYNTLTGDSFSKLVVVPIYEQHHIVERENDTNGKFVGTLPLNGDKRVEAAKKKNGGSLIKLLSVDRDPPTKLNETRDVHVAILEEDGLTFKCYGVIQGESTNLLPLKVWKNERVAVCMPKKKNGVVVAPAKPVFSLRAVITTDVKPNNVTDEKTGKEAQFDSYVYKIVPFGGTGKWSDGALRASVPEELELMQNFAIHRQQIVDGLMKVDYRGDDGGEDEAAAEDASFDPDDDGRPAAAQSTVDTVGEVEESL